MKTKSLVFVVAAILLHLASYAFGDTTRLTIPLAGNTFLTVRDSSSQDRITDNGLEYWSGAKSVFSTYVWIGQSGKLHLEAVMEPAVAASKIRIRIGRQSRQVSIPSRKANTGAEGAALADWGVWEVQGPGYVKIDLQGIRRSGQEFAQVKAFRVSGSAVNAQATAVKDNQDAMYHFGRRGPSVHLNYEVATAGDSIEWFYNEIHVPEGEDVLGSYFMANGFGEGYFGMQVNSPTERRVLFSVWSPFHTDNPKEIPADQQIRLLKKGEGVYTGEFGNEGSGGQSYWKFPWKAGTTYRFLLRAIPVAGKHTEYTAWFFAPELNRWQLIASFSRPKTHTWLRRLHSFLENFQPTTGYIPRKGLYQNQWVRNNRGEWFPVSRARFSADATARKRYRLDYSGGVEGNAFFLRNCGFYYAPTPLGKVLERQGNAAPPEIDLLDLQ